MKKSILFIVLVFVLILSACGKNANPSRNSGDTGENNISTNQSGTSSSEKALDEETLSIIDDYLYYTTVSANLIHATFEVGCDMWENIYKYSDYDDVTKTFNYIIDTAGSRKTIEDANATIGRLYVEILTSGYDEKCISMISKCHTNYLVYQGCFLNPTGNYSSFKEVYSQARDAYMEDVYYNIVDYFESVGYERKDRSA